MLRQKDLKDRIIVETRTTKNHALEIDRSLLLALLEHAGISVPDNATIVFRVPGGGDWSNENVDVSDRDPIRVTWSTKE